MTVHAFASTSATRSSPDETVNLIPGVTDRHLVLASSSQTLFRLLAAAGLAIRVAPSDHEQMNTVQAVLRTMPELDAADVAELHVRTRLDGACALFPGAIVIGAQQVVSLDGKLQEVPRTVDGVRDLLLELQGKTHQLHSAIALAEEGEVTWSSVDTAHVSLRPLSPQFIGKYIAAIGDGVVGCPGGYELDGAGLQLIDSIDGAFPAMLGAPLFPLLARLRQIGFLAT
jgi:septum formation protein